MTIRFAILCVFAPLVLSIPAAASQPEGLAGEIISSAPSPDPSIFCEFKWFLGDWEMPLNPNDTVTLDFAIVPFSPGLTIVGLRFGPYSVDGVSMIFADGLVMGIPYDRNRWNDVTVLFDLARNEYDVTVNGRHGGPFSASACLTSPCTTLRAFVFQGSSQNPAGATAWIDTVSVIRHSSAGNDFYVGFDAKPCSDDFTGQSVHGGGIVFLDPPKNLRPPK